jgi:hypothetical protein
MNLPNQNALLRLGCAKREWCGWICVIGVGLAVVLFICYTHPHGGL